MHHCEVACRVGVVAWVALGARKTRLTLVEARTDGPSGSGRVGAACPASAGVGLREPGDQGDPKREARAGLEGAQRVLNRWQEHHPDRAEGS